jgi:uncharacterized membrane protein
MKVHTAVIIASVVLSDLIGLAEFVILVIADLLQNTICKCTTKNV